MVSYTAGRDSAVVKREFVSHVWHAVFNLRIMVVYQRVDTLATA